MNDDRIVYVISYLTSTRGTTTRYVEMRAESPDDAVREVRRWLQATAVILAVYAAVPPAAWQ